MKRRIQQVAPQPDRDAPQALKPQTLVDLIVPGANTGTGIGVMGSMPTLQRSGPIQPAGQLQNQPRPNPNTGRPRLQGPYQRPTLPQGTPLQNQGVTYPNPNQGRPYMPPQTPNQNQPPPGTTFAPDGSPILPAGWSAIGGPNDQGLVYVQGWNQMAPDQQQALINRVKGYDQPRIESTSDMGQGGIQPVGQTPEGWYYDANGQFYSPQGWALQGGYYMGNGGNMYANPNDPQWGVEGAGNLPLVDAYQPQGFQGQQPAQQQAHQQGVPPFPQPQGLAWQPQQAPVQNDPNPPGRGNYQGPGGGQGLTNQQLQNQFNNLRSRQEQQQFLLAHPRFADLMGYGNVTSRATEGLKRRQPTGQPMGQGDYQGNGPNSRPIANDQGAYQGNPPVPQGQPIQDDQGGYQGPPPAPMPSQNPQNRPTLPLSPEAEAVRRGLEDELAAELASISTERGQIPAMVELFSSRLQTDHAENLRQIDEGLNARGVFNSGIRSTDRGRANRDVDRRREDFARDVAGNYSSLAGRESGAYRNFNNRWTEALLGLVRGMAQDESYSASGTAGGGPTPSGLLGNPTTDLGRGAPNVAQLSKPNRGRKRRKNNNGRPRKRNR